MRSYESLRRSIEAAVRLPQRPGRFRAMMLEGVASLMGSQQKISQSRDRKHDATPSPSTKPGVFKRDAMEGGLDA